MSSTVAPYKSTKLYIMGTTSALGSIAWGYNLTIINSIDDFLKANVYAAEQDSAGYSLITSIVTIGAALGALLCGLILDRSGRRAVLMMADIICGVGSVLCLIHSLPLMVIGRFLVGLSIGFNSVTISLYNVEMAPKVIKGTIGCLSMAGLSIGLLAGLAVGYLMPEPGTDSTSQMWRILLAIPIIFNILRFLMFAFIFRFETPLFLASKGRTGEARASLEQIYAEKIDRQLKRCVKAAKDQGHLNYFGLFSEAFKKATWATILMGASIQLCGFAPIFLRFDDFVTQSANGNQPLMDTYSTIFGVLSLLTTFVTTYLLDKTGRKPLLILGSALCFIDLLIFILVTVLDSASNHSLKVILVVWPIFYRLSTGTIGWVYFAELMPAVGVAFANFVSWAIGFLTTEGFLLLQPVIDIYGVMIIFAACSLISTILLSRVIIESKGRSKPWLRAAYAGRRTSSLFRIEMNENSRAGSTDSLNLSHKIGESTSHL